MNQTLEVWISKKKDQITEMQMMKRKTVQDFIYAVWGVLFPGFSDEIEDKDSYFDLKMGLLKKDLTLLLRNIEDLLPPHLKIDGIVQNFVKELPKIDDLLSMDLDAIYDGDPAATSKSEIVLCYPGFYAIFMYRVAHTLHLLQVPLLPRVLSEVAHSKTGIDIHPAATIGHHFFIDHGTGIVIGETTTIGNYVKIYQGVTLGALSLKEGHKLKGSQRHPTILDYVTIYSEASILGGDTIIGPNVTIGSNAFITKSVSQNHVNQDSTRQNM